MKKLLVILIPLLIASVVFGIFFLIFGKGTSRGALQVTSSPKSNVFINNKLIGQTPLCKCEGEDMIQTGTYTIRVIPQEQGYIAFEEKITINKSVLTVVDRSFGQGTSSQGSVITLTPISDKNSVEMLVLSLPEKAEVFLDNNREGVTPLALKQITDSDHEIRLSKEGYLEKSVRIRTVKGYKLSATVYLGVNPQPLLPTPTPTPSVPVSEKVTILQTPTGFLRVRKEPSMGSAEILRVRPGESYEVLAEQEGWYNIKLTDGSGWISSDYASKE